MRSVIIMAAGLATAMTGAADAQRVVTRGPGAGYPVPGPGGPVVHPSAGRVPIAGQPGGSRWGSRIDGRWWGGANAAGGWGAYRRPVRGYALPRYWVSPRFYVNDWQAYGLRQPAYGYNWVRYYDDAVLIDSHGSVFDSRSGLDWDRLDGGYEGYATDGYADNRGYDRRDNGLGGAAIGAVAGGVAGNLIAGRGNRLGGTLIGAGVGAAAGYAIDKAEDRGRYDDRRGVPVAPPSGAGYAPPAGYADGGYADGGYDYPPPPVAHPADWVSPDGRTTVTTTTAGYGTGYWGGGGTTTVVVQSAPVVTTTTTTEVIEDHVTYTRAPARKVRSWKPKTRCYCR